MLATIFFIISASLNVLCYQDMLSYQLSFLIIIELFFNFAVQLLTRKFVFLLFKYRATYLKPHSSVEQ